MPRRSVFSADTTNAITQRAVNAWLKIAPKLGGAEPASVSILKDWGHSIVFRLEKAAPGGTGVIAKRSTPVCAEVESFVYQEILPNVDVPALQCYGCVGDDAEGEHCWLYLEDAGDQKYSYVSEVHRAMAGRWLAAIHSVTAQLPAPRCVPQRPPAWYLTQLRALREGILGILANPALDHDDLRTLEAIVAQCDVIESHWRELAQLCQGMPQTLVHGDLSAKNTRVRTYESGHSLFAIDWETASWGAPAIDLASLSPDLQTYLSAFRPESAEAGVVTRVVIAGRIFRLIVSMSWEKKRLASDWPKRGMRHMAQYHACLSDTIQAAGWRMR